MMPPFFMPPMPQVSVPQNLGYQRPQHGFDPAMGMPPLPGFRPSPGGAPMGSDFQTQLHELLPRLFEAQRQTAEADGQKADPTNPAWRSSDLLHGLLPAIILGALGGPSASGSFAQGYVGGKEQKAQADTAADQKALDAQARLKEASANEMGVRFQVLQGEAAMQAKQESEARKFEQDKEMERLRSAGRLTIQQHNALMKIAPEGRAAYAQNVLHIMDPEVLQGLALPTPQEQAQSAGAGLSNARAAETTQMLPGKVQGQGLQNRNMGLRNEALAIKNAFDRSMNPKKLREQDVEIDRIIAQAGLTADQAQQVRTKTSLLLPEFRLREANIQSQIVKRGQATADPGTSLKRADMLNRTLRSMQEYDRDSGAYRPRKGITQEMIDQVTAERNNAIFSATGQAPPSGDLDGFLKQIIGSGTSMAGVAATKGAPMPDEQIKRERAEAMRYYSAPGADKAGIAAEFKKRTGRDLIPKR